MLRTSDAAAFGLGIPGILPGPEASQPRSLRPTLALSPQSKPVQRSNVSASCDWQPAWFASCGQASVAKHA